MVRCEECLESWRKKDFYAFMTLQVHDEVVFDLPKRAHPLKDPKNSNLSRVKELARLMSLGGEDMGFPCPVGLGYNEHHWGSEVVCQ